MTVRDSILAQVLEISKTNPNIMLECATGVGKSKIALEVMNKFSPKNVLLCVAEIVHKENWKEQFRTWNIPYPEGLVIITYASLKNYTNTSWDMVILDECHHTNTEIRSALLNTLSTQRVLALSATIDKEVLETLQCAFGDFYVWVGKIKLLFAKFFCEDRIKVFRL